MRRVPACVSKGGSFRASSQVHFAHDKRPRSRASSVQMENLLEFPANGRVVPVGFHEVGHLVPPFPNDRVLRQTGRSTAVCQFLHGEKRQRLFVQKNGVVRNAGGGKGSSQLGPDLVVAPFVFPFEAALELHREGVTVHDGFFGLNGFPRHDCDRTCACMRTFSRLDVNERKRW